MQTHLARQARLRVVFAPDSFKGSIRASAAASALAEGWRRRRPLDETICLPMADGGEGTLEAFAAAHPDSRRVGIEVEGPLGRREHAHWLLLPATAARPETAVVELASTAGIELFAPSETLRAMEASSIGFGQAIRAALEHGVGRMILAIGSSASSDGGAGVLTALGARLLDREGRQIARGAIGLETVSTIDLSKMAPAPLAGAVVLTDVTAPLLGSAGAARVFGPQKGATPDEVRRIEQALERWAALLGTDPDAPGAGAAGGVGFGLFAWGATAVAGAQAVAELVGVNEAVLNADLVITGEGSFDAQSAAGKAPSQVLRVAREAGVPAVVVAGRVAPGLDGDVDTVSLVDLAGEADDAMRRPAHWLREAGALISERITDENTVE